MKKDVFKLCASGLCIWIFFAMVAGLLQNTYGQEKKDGGSPFTELTTLYSENFERSALGNDYDSYLRNIGMPQTFTQPRIVNYRGSNRAELTAKDSQEVFLYLKESVGGTLSSYTMEFDVDITKVYRSETSTFEVGFNVANIVPGATEFQFSGYKIVFNTHQGTFLLIRRTASIGSSQPLLSGSSFRLNPDSSFHIKIEVLNRNIKAYYNTPGAQSELLFDYTDNSANPFLMGTVFWGNKSSVVKIDNVQIYSNPELFITVQSPNGGEAWPVFSTQTIRWVTNSSSTVNISLVKGDNLELVRNLGSVPASSGSYTFVISDQTDLKRNDLRVKITGDNDGSYDISDQPFTIGKAKLISPSGGQLYTYNSSQTITYTAEGLRTPVIEYLVEGGNNWLPLTGVSNGVNQSVTWNVGQVSNGRMKLRIRDGAAGENIKDEGNYFTVANLTITKPGQGDVFAVGSNPEIRWTPTSLIGNINIYFLKDDNSPPVPIALNVNASTGVYTLWQTPDILTKNGKIKLVSVNYPDLISTSGAFRIGKLTLLNLNGGEKLFTGLEYNIYWDGEEGTDNLDIHLSTNNGLSWENVIINSQQASAGFYKWTVGDNLTTSQAKVRIRDVANNSISDISEAPFKIASLKVISQNTIEHRQPGSVLRIIWSSGNIDAVDIFLVPNGGGVPISLGINITASTGYIDYTVTGLQPGDYKVKITETGNPQFAAYSNGTVRIADVKLVTPNGGEVLQIGKKMRLTWTKSHNVSSLNFDISTDGGVNWIENVITGVNASESAFDWVIDRNLPSSNVRMRIKDAAATNISDISNASFDLKLLELNNPAAYRDTLLIGDQFPVQWTHGNVNNIRIDLSTDDGNTWGTTIINSTAASAGQYNAVVPVSPALNAKIKISDAQFPSKNITDSSDISFRITGVKLLSPNFGAFETGSNQIIRWKAHTSVTSVRISYSSDNGVSWSVIPNGGNVTASNGQIQWRVPSVITQAGLIKVEDVSYPAISYDRSDNPFSIGTLSVREPAGGDIWQVGSVHKIRWNSITSVSQLKIRFVSPEKDTVIASGVSVYQDGFDWLVPNYPTYSGRIIIYDNSDTTISAVSGVFTISDVRVLSPDGGEVYQSGKLIPIRWYSKNIDQMKIEYSTNNGANWLEIVTTGAAGGGYDWYPDEYVTSQTVKIKLSNNAQAAVNDYSYNFFTIKKLKITRPVDNEGFTFNTPQAITWESGNISSVKIELSTDNGYTWLSPPVSAATNAGAGSFNWSVGSSFDSKTAKIRLSDVNYPYIRDSSDLPFTIGFINQISPGTGVIVKSGSSIDITWDNSASIDNVDIYYSVDGGVTWEAQKIASSYPVTNTNNVCTWVIPDNIQTTMARVMVVDSKTGSILDRSDNFTIHNLKINSPAGGEYWQAGTTKQISWGPTTVNRVTIEYKTSSTDTNWIPIPGASNISSASGIFNWNIPAGLSTAACSLRIKDVNRPEIYHITQSFKIGSIQVTNPLSSDVMQTGKRDTIRWIASSSVNKVNIEFQVNNGPFNLIASNLNAQTGFYFWDIEDLPGNSSTNVKVRVRDAESPNATDIYSTSSAFTLIYLKVNSPNGGEYFQTMRRKEIKWDKSTFISAFKVEISTNSGVSWRTIEPNAVTQANSTTGSYFWNIPSDTVSSACKIRLTSLSYPHISDESDNVFKIVELKLTSPIANTIWKSDTQKQIKWGSKNNSTVYFRLSQDGGLNYNYQIPGVFDAAAGVTNWSIPEDYGSKLAVLKIISSEDEGVYDTSTVFSIARLKITDPNTVKDYQAEKTMPLSWIAGGVDQVRLEYSFDNGRNWGMLRDNVQPSVNNLTWNIPDSTTTLGLIKLTDKRDTSIYDINDANFTVSRLKVLSPAGGERYLAGKFIRLTWNSDPSVQTVKAQLKLNSSSTWQDIGEFAAQAGFINYQIDTAVYSGNAKFRLLKTSNSEIVSESGEFKITKLKINRPNGGEILQAGSPYTVTYEAKNSSGELKLLISTNGGVRWDTIASDLNPGLNNYNWVVPSSPAQAARLMLLDKERNDFFDVSDGEFAIGGVSITGISTSTIWQTGKTHRIQWTYNNLQNLVIQFSSDNGNNWDIVHKNSQSVSAAQGFYDWQIPDGNAYASALSRIRILSYENNSISAISPVFRVAFLRIKKPKGGEYFQSGAKNYITWESRAVSSLKMEYSLDNGNSWNILESAIPAGGGQYEWLTDQSTFSKQAKVRLSDVNSSVIKTESDSVFTISKIKVTYPNASTVWQAGTMDSVIWDSDPSVERVKISISFNGGDNWEIINSNYDAGLKIIRFTVGDAPAMVAQVKIEALNSSLLSSSGNFTIMKLQLISPNGGEVIQGGKPLNIGWNIQYGGSHLRILYSSDDGLNWNPLDNYYPASLQAYVWNVPDTLSSVKMKIRIAVAGNEKYFDQSDNTFTLTNLKLIRPTGGEVWQAGTLQRISWKADSSTSRIDLLLSKDGGISFPQGQKIVPNFNAAAGYYDWIVDSTYYSDSVVIKIARSDDNSISNTSGVFSISKLRLVYPNGNELWQAGKTYRIRWTQANAGSYIKIQYTTDDGISWLPVINSYNSYLEFFDWEVPENVYGNQFRIKITDLRNENFSDMSDSRFSIARLEFVSPQAGDLWQMGSRKIIKWRNNFSGSLKLEFSSNNGISWQNISGNISQTDSTTEWIVDDPRGEQYSMLRLVSLSDESINAVSKSFRIVSVKLLQPNGNEFWTAGTTNIIKWETTNIDTVNLEISFDENAGYGSIAERIRSSNGTNQYEWTVPPQSSSNARIRVRHYKRSDISDESDFTFRIGNLSLLTPAAGDLFNKSERLRISWDTSNAALIGDLRIYLSTDGGVNWGSPIVPSVRASAGFIDYDMSQVSTGDRSRIKLVSVSDTNFNALSGLFTIGKLNLSTLTGGEFLKSGSQARIEWESSFVDTVNIRLSTNGGVSWDQTLIQGLRADIGYYIWNIPSALVSNNIKIRLEAKNKISFSDISDSNIVIADLTVLTPNGGENIQAGIPYSITFLTSVNIDSVNIHFRRFQDTAWLPLGSKKVTAGNNSFSWLPLQENVTTKGLVRITYPRSGGSIADQSNNFFTVNNLELTYPTGTRYFKFNEIIPVRWRYGGVVENLRIEYVPLSGPPQLLTSSHPANDTSFSFVAGNSSSSGQIRIISGSLSDISDTIHIANISLTRPRSNDRLQTGKETRIQWAASNNIDSVKIEMSISDEGENWTTLNNGNALPSGIGSYKFIPDSASINAKVRVSGSRTATANISAFNQLPFIISRLDLSHPQGGEQFIAGDLLRINWQQSRNLSKIKFYLSTDGGVNWPYDTTIINNGNYSGEIRWRIRNEINSPNCRLRIQSDAPLDTGITAVSGLFTILKPLLDIVSPNGNEYLQAGKPALIRWTADNNVNSVIIKYSQNGIDSFMQISPVILASAGEWSWNIPVDYDTKTGRILIESTLNPIIYSKTAGIFNIGNIHLLAPNGSEGKWQTGSLKKIRWQNSASVAKVKIDYSTDGGSSWRIYATNIDAAAGFMDITIPEFPTTAARFRVSDHSSQNQIKDENTESISFVSLRLNRPVVTDTLQAGKKFRFTWNNSVGINTLRIMYRMNNVSDWIIDDNSISASNRQFEWTVPADLYSSSLELKIADETDTTIYSNVPGAITVKRLLLTEPAGGRRILANSSQPIRWIQNFCDSVNIYYSLNNGQNWELMAESVPGTTGAYTWQVGDFSSTECLVKIQDYHNSHINSVNELPFTIFKPAVQVIYPNSNISLQAGKQLTVRWNHQLFDTVMLAVSYDNGLSYEPVINRVPASLGEYTFVPDNNRDADSALIKISSVEYPGYFDISDQPFRIYKINLTSFNDYEFYESGQEYRATWDVSAFASRLKLEILYDSTQPPLLLRDNITASLGLLDFTMPSVPSKNAKLVLSVADPGAAGITTRSITGFVIGRIGIVKPIASSILQENSLFTIELTKTGSIDLVDIEYSRTGNFNDSRIIANGFSGTTLNWIIPEGYYSPAAKIRISATGSQLRISEVSDSFRLASVEITQPRAGDNWDVGNNHIILFNTKEVNSDLELWLSLDTPERFSRILGSAGSTDSTFSWEITEDLISDSARILIKSVDGRYSDTTGFFRLYKPFLSLEPVQNKKYAYSGKNYEIIWTSTNVQNVRIEYSYSDTSSFRPIRESYPCNNGVNKFNWITPDTLASDRVKIKITDLNNQSVESVLPFNLKVAKIELISPVAGEVLQAGKTREITWRNSANVDFVNIKCRYERYGDTVGVVYNFPAAGGSYSWQIPDTVANNVLLTVELVGSEGIISDSGGAAGNQLKRLYIISPSESEFVTIPGKYRIKWAASSNVSRIKLEYTMKDGAPSLIQSNIPANLGSYEWNVPQDSAAFSTDSLNMARVLITDINAPEVNNKSKYFVFGGLKILKPNGGEVFLSNTPTTIKWNNTKNIDFIRIEYTTDDGATWYLPDGMNRIDANTETKSIDWNIRANPSDKCRIKISRTNNPSSVADISDTTFTISELKLLSPQNGEYFVTGNPCEIKWSSRFINKIDLILLVDNQEKAIIAQNIDADSGRIIWNIPDDIQLASKNAKILIKDHTSSEAKDSSDAPFSINHMKIQNPAAQQAYGSKILIQWLVSSSTISKINIQYSTNTGQSWNKVADTLNAAINQYLWDWRSTTDIAEAKNNILLRIQSSENNLLYLNSEPFSISYLQINRYTGNEPKMIQTGRKFSLGWRNEGNFSRLALDYSIDGGVYWNTMDGASDIDAQLRKFDWLVPDNATKNGRVRIRSMGPVIDTSYIETDSFNIVKLEVNSPNERIAWNTGSEQTISWDSENIENVRIWISRDDGLTKTTLFGSVPADSGKITWTVDDKYKTTKAKIIVTDARDFQITDVSDTSFIIAKFPTIIPLERYQSNNIAFIYTLNTPGEVLSLTNFEYRKDDNYLPIALSSFPGNPVTLNFGSGQILWNSKYAADDFSMAESTYNFRFTFTSSLGVSFSVNLDSVGIDNLPPRLYSRNMEIYQNTDTLGWDKIRLRINEPPVETNGPVTYRVFKSIEGDTLSFDPAALLETRNPEELLLSGLYSNTAYALKFVVRDRFNNNIEFIKPYQTLIAGDLDTNGNNRGVINSQDMNLFIKKWTDGVRKAVDLYPYSGEPEGQVKIIGNGVLNYEDIYTFVRIYNQYFNRQISGIEIPEILPGGVFYDRINMPFSSNGDSLVVNLPAGYDSVDVSDITVGIGSDKIRIDSFYLDNQKPAHSDNGILTVSGRNNHGDVLVINRAFLSRDAVKEKSLVLKFSFDKYFIPDKDSIIVRINGYSADHKSEFSLTRVYKVNFVPAEYKLYQNYPNPFNPSTNILFDLPEDADVSLVVYDILGSRVREVIHEPRKAGRHKIVFDSAESGGRLASGVYFMRLSAGSYNNTIKMILIK